MSDHMKESQIKELQRQMQHIGPQRGDVYLHYKGSLYLVIGRALREADLVDMVVYQHLGSGYVWTRPLKEWGEQVMVGGIPHTRFLLQEGRVRL